MSVPCTHIYVEVGASKWANQPYTVVKFIEKNTTRKGMKKYDNDYKYQLYHTLEQHIFTFECSKQRLIL